MKILPFITSFFCITYGLFSQSIDDAKKLAKSDPDFHLEKITDVVEVSFGSHKTFAALQKKLIAA